MKKVIRLVVLLQLAGTLACTASGPAGAVSGPGAASSKRCARYEAAVFKQENQTEWLATLARGEEVTLLGESDLANPKNPKETTRIARVRLADDKVGFIRTDNLALKLVAFAEDAQAYERNTSSSNVKAEIPAGVSGALVDQKGEWLQVIARARDHGEFKVAYKVWVNKGTTEVPEQVEEARQLDRAMDVLQNPKAKAEDSAQAKKALELLAGKSSPAAAIARGLLEKQAGTGAGASAKADAGNAPIGVGEAPISQGEPAKADPTPSKVP